MNWTEEQREVIETRDKNILVSACLLYTSDAADE